MNWKSRKTHLAMILLVLLIIFCGYFFSSVQPDNSGNLTVRAQSGDTVALAKLEAMAEAGDVHAQAALGWVYTILQPPLNCSKAVKWLLEAANAGYIPSQIYLSDVYNNGCVHGEIPRNVEEAYFWRLIAVKTSKVYPNLFEPLPSSSYIRIDRSSKPPPPPRWQTEYEKELTSEQINATEERVAAWKPRKSIGACWLIILTATLVLAAGIFYWRKNAKVRYVPN